MTITYNDLAKFAYSNDKLINGEIKGIAVNFYGLNNVEMLERDPVGDLYATKGILYLIPYLNPWAWMNDFSIAMTDDLIDILCEKYNLDKNIGVCSSGGSMGGGSALVFTALSRHNIISCVVNCPVCDSVFHSTERPDVIRTMYSAFGANGDYETQLEKHSAIHLLNRMPKIKYVFFHCTADGAVSKANHSDRMVKAMRENGFDVKYYEVPDRGHCDLPEEVWATYREEIMTSFN